MQAYVEGGAGFAFADATVAWTFEPVHWGLAGQGTDEPSALAALAHATGQPARVFDVAERIHGDEWAFGRDHEPARAEETALTLEILAIARQETVALVRSATPAELDWRDPDRLLPDWARWHTLRQMAWHVADTESRYYLTGLGEQPLARGGDLLDELRRSHEHVRATLARLEPDRVRQHGDERWTTVKVLRRLAWHEPAELAVMRRLLARCRAGAATIGPPPPPAVTA